MIKKNEVLRQFFIFQMQQWLKGPEYSQLKDFPAEHIPDIYLAINKHPLKSSTLSLIKQQQLDGGGSRRRK